MYIRVITSRYDESLRSFPEEALKQATFGREIIDKRIEFFDHLGVPHIVFILTLSDSCPSGRSFKSDSGSGSFGGRKSADDPGDIFTGELRTAYFDFKKWRNGIGKKLGIPFYSVARNSLLVDIMAKRPKSIAELKEIFGCGEKFCKDYGKEIIAMMANIPEVPADVVAAIAASAAVESAKKKSGKKGTESNAVESTAVVDSIESEAVAETEDSSYGESDFEFNIDESVK